MAYLRFFIRIILILVWATVLPLLFLIGRSLKIKGHSNIVHCFHRGLQKLLSLKVQFSGQICQQRPTLYVSNHISYLDVPVLGELRSFFIAKSEVASWPVIGAYAKFQNTLFFERKSLRAREQIKRIKSHLQQKQSITLFAEGTSTDGSCVKEFKSSLLEAANIQNMKVAIQPVTVCYTHYNNKPITREQLDYYAWYADMPFGSHFLNVLTLKSATVKVHFHPVVYLDSFETRKACAQHCQKVVAEKMAEFLSSSNRLEVANETV